MTAPLLGSWEAFCSCLCVFSLTRERNALFTGPRYEQLTYKEASCSQQLTFSSVLELFPLYGQDTDHDDKTLQPREMCNHSTVWGSWLWLTRSWGLHTELWAKRDLFSFFLWLVLSEYLYINSECYNRHFESIWPVTRDYLPMVPSLMLGRKGITAGPRKHTRSHCLCLPEEADKLCQFCILQVVII